MIHNAWHSQFKLGLVFTVRWFRLGVSVVHTLIGRYTYPIAAPGEITGGAPDLPVSNMPYARKQHEKASTK